MPLVNDSLRGRIREFYNLNPDEYLHFEEGPKRFECTQVQWNNAVRELARRDEVKVTKVLVKKAANDL